MYSISPYQEYKSNKPLIKEMDDKAILAKYLNITKLPVLIKAPYRADNMPSLGITLKNGKVFFKDFAKGISGSVYDLLCLMWRCSIKEVWKRLAENEYVPSDNYNIIFSKPSTDIKIKVRKWQKRDIEYWESFGCSMPIIKKCRVVPISHYLVNSKLYEADKLAYAYVLEDNDTYYYKVYQPLSKYHKWVNNYPKGTINLLHLLEGDCNDTLAVCSSVKDAICLMSQIKGVTAVCGQSECLSEIPIIPFLKDLYTKVVIIFDNDESGVKHSQVLADKYEITNLVIPQFLGGKDISDCYKQKKFNPLITELWRNI